jgi:hypothetical protein
MAVRGGFLIVCAVLPLTFTAANSQECTRIVDPTARLACFDKGTVHKPKMATPSAGPPPITADMTALRNRLDSSFLQAGMSVEVSVQNVGATGSLLAGTHVPYPALVFFGYFDRVSVYKIGTTLPLFHDAHAASFKTVEFISKGDGGTWIFDMTKDGQVCARDLCFQQ